MIDQNEQALEAQLRTEIEAVHAFIGAWFRGEVANDRAKFSEELENRFADGFINIQPSGRALSASELSQPMFESYGSNPKFRISIREFRILTTAPGLAVACYVEDQTGAKNSIPSDNSRISTVVFRLLGEGQRPQWVHLQETALI